MNDMTLKSTRITLEKINIHDAEFMIKLYNSASYIKYIGERNINTIPDAETYITEKFEPVYASNTPGIGYYKIVFEHKAIGTCGIMKREELELPDLGFALLAEYENQGFGYEAAQCLIAEIKKHQIFKALCAITLPINIKCIQLLAKLGFKYENTITLPHGTEALNLYKLEL